MNCSKCNNVGIKNSANGKEFWFCSTCRDEIIPLVEDGEDSKISTGGSSYPYGEYNEWKIKPSNPSFMVSPFFMEVSTYSDSIERTLKELDNSMESFMNRIGINFDGDEE